MNKIAQKSIYLSLLLLTDMDRSFGSTFAHRLSKDQRKAKYKRYVKKTFKEFELLCPRIEDQTLQRQDVRDAIARIKRVVGRISFGQAQKGLNVLLKYHCLLFHDHEAIIDELDCPLDKQIQEHLWGNGRNIFLTKIDKQTYDLKQDGIPEPKVKYDLFTDKQSLRKWGLTVPRP